MPVIHVCDVCAKATNQKLLARIRVEFSVVRENKVGRNTPSTDTSVLACETCRMNVYTLITGDGRARQVANYEVTLKVN